MKVRDSNGEIKKVVLQANDSIPAGSVIDFDGNVVPEGYEKVEDIISNNDGVAIKFSNGILIQYGAKNCTVNANSNGGFTHYYSQNTFSFPTNFNDSSYKIFANVNSENVTIINLVYASVKTVDTFGLNFISSNNNDTRTIQWFAIGKLK